MSVLIKDMEMPKKCGECGIYVCYRTWHGDPGNEFCGLTKKGVKYKTKPEWCPLSEVPERKTGKWITECERQMIDDVIGSPTWLDIASVRTIERI